MENKERIKYFKDKKIIAIDPGKNGGIVVYSIDRDKLLEVAAMPDTPQDVLKLLSVYQCNARCYLEKVGGMPGQGGSAMFNFGRGYGHIEMALLSRNIKTITVTPQQWQKCLQVGNKGKKTTTEWKMKLKEKAQQIYPRVGTEFGLVYKKDWLAISDALLILEYARLTEKI